MLKKICGAIVAAFSVFGAVCAALLSLRCRNKDCNHGKPAQCNTGECADDDAVRERAAELRAGAGEAFGRAQRSYSELEGIFQELRASGVYVEDGKQN